ncbi:catenin delta-2-like isoform X2 [Oppia nitens]|uniref:catenin delta-2-like isoform X2 n=1 Tax=Oppia nitens TaxID=1686743 RepID=UPI0023DCB9F3|nr:catenin delta-2-like isoform X2 [Oppia nitens]
MDLQNNTYQNSNFRYEGSATPSMVSESGAMNHPLPPTGYYELDQSQHQPLPNHTLNPAIEDPYGYGSRPSPQMHSPGGSFYNTYDNAPQGYLDNRPSFDDYANYVGPMHGPQYNMTASQIPQTVYEEESPYVSNSHPMMAPMRPMAGVEHLVLPADSSGDVRYRDPDLHEVIEFLNHPNNIVRANAAAYLQHLCFMDDNMKSKTRALGGIPPLINLLSQETPELQRNACGALRNLSYGRQNDENKRAIRNASGIPALVRLLRKTVDNEIRELVTGVLWNLSSSEELKRPIIDDALTVLVNVIIIPHSGWDRSIDPNVAAAPGVMNNCGDIYWSTVFRNGSGVLRNVSSAGEYARRKLRECEGLVDALLYLVRSAIGKNDMDNKSVENCVCILRNLSYRCQEVIDPEYDKHYYANQNNSLSPSSSRAAAIMGGLGNKVGDNLGCFGGSKKKSKDSSTSLTSPSAISSPISSLDTQTKQLTISGNSGANGTVSPMSTIQRPRLEPARGMELLWQTEVVQPYLALLSECSNPETLEAAAGAIQNLSACFWQPSIDIRGAVRKEKGLPILVELLRMEVDRVVCAVATALRNLAMDTRNKELIGKYALKDLVSKLPNGNPQHDSNASDDTVAAVLATLNEVISKNPDFAKSLLEAGGLERLTIIVKQKGKFSPRVSKFTSQLLFNMWQHIELREVYKKAGWKESHFIINPRTLLSRTNSTSTPNSANNTLTRPMSTVGGTRYEDRTLPRNGGTGHTVNMSQMQRRPEELALSDMNHTDGILSPNQQHLQQQQQQPLLHRPQVAGVPVYPPGAQPPQPHGY